MARTTTASVQGILGDQNWDGSTDLQQFVDAASAIVTRVQACAIAKGMTLTVEELELIERWLAAHCYCSFDQTYASKNTSGAGGSFHGQTGMHLEGTKYGQMALNLDWSGCLTAISKRQFAGGFWMGKRPSDQVDYDQRS